MLAGLLVGLSTAVPAVPDPRLYDFARWASDVREHGFGDAPMFATEERWTEWADYLTSTAAGLQCNLPSPQGFANWQDWAQRVYQLTS